MRSPGLLSEIICNLELTPLFIKLQLGINDVEVSEPPSCYEVEYQTLLSPEAVKFVTELVRQFDKNVDQVGVIHVYDPVSDGCCKLDQTCLIPLGSNLSRHVNHKLL